MQQPFWLECAKKLSAIANTGLFYSTNPYDRERYEQIQVISNELITNYSKHIVEEVEKFGKGDDGYITPKVDVRALIIIDNKIVMVQEKADNKWCIPGGWADVGYTPFEVAVKESREEAGIFVEPIRLLAVMDKKCHAHPPSPFYSYKIFVLCKYVEGKLCAGTETLDVQLFELNNLPELSIDRLTKEQLDIIWERYKDERMLPYCE